VGVYRTFAEGESHAWRLMGFRKAVRAAPEGRVHASEADGLLTLCGRSTSDLFEFGRSRYPFERTPSRARCPTCNELAGRPTEG
jgi:hypothetical protein